MKTALTTGLAGVVGLMIGYGCAGTPTQRMQAEAHDPQPTAEVDPDTGEPPAYIREASLPEGYPSPGQPGRIEIKHYPAVRLVRARAEDHGGPNRLFRPLFNHIKKHEIAMTSPVEMTYATGGEEPRPALQSMAFIYPSRETGTLGPDDKVQVLEAEPLTVLSVGVRGGYTTNRFAKQYRVLEAWLAEQETYEASGPPRYLAYNSPFVPGFMKYGEVQIPVREVGAGD